MEAKEFLSEYAKLKDILDTGEADENEKALILKKMKHIRNTINKINKPMSSILLGRYIGGKSLKEISKESSYSYDYVRHKHKDALREIERIINKK